MQKYIVGTSQLIAAACHYGDDHVGDRATYFSVRCVGPGPGFASRRRDTSASMIIRRTLGIVGLLTLSSTVLPAGRVCGWQKARQPRRRRQRIQTAADADAAPASTPTTAPPSPAIEKPTPPRNPMRLLRQPDHWQPRHSPADARVRLPLLDADALWLRPRQRLAHANRSQRRLRRPRANGFQLQNARVGVRAQLGDRIRAEFSRWTARSMIVNRSTIPTAR